MIPQKSTAILQIISNQVWTETVSFLLWYVEQGLRFGWRVKKLELALWENAI